jgi:tetratricopeptide (TPR) repeat protein
MRTGALLLLTAVAVAQEKAAPLAVEAILVKPEELPKGVRLVEGIHCVSPQARTYFETPSMKDIARKLTPEAVEQFPPGFLEQFPVPKRKECQSFEAEGRPPGSILVYEYEEGDADTALAFLTPYIWGDRRSEQHPEEIVAEGRFIWVLSFPFPRADPAAEWYKERLRKKLRVHAPRERPEFIPLGQEFAKAYSAQDAEAGIKLAQENAKVLEDWAFGQYFLGEFAALKGDHALAEKGYRKALDLHDRFVDPVEPAIVYASLDGLGVALHVQGKREEAVKTLKRAISAAEETGVLAIQSAARSTYNLACAYSMMRKYADALGALKDAIAKDPQYKEMARTDGDFAEARKRKEFQELLK